MNMLEIPGFTDLLDVLRQVDFDFFHLRTGQLQGNHRSLKLIKAIVKNAQCVLQNG